MVAFGITIYVNVVVCPPLIFLIGLRKFNLTYCGIDVIYVSCVCKDGSHS